MLTDKQALAIAMAAMRDACNCESPDRTPPTDWKTGARIPHHCDCMMYAIELPDPAAAPTAHADALKRRTELLERTFSPYRATLELGAVRVFDSVRVKRAQQGVAEGEVGIVHTIRDGKAGVDFRRHRTAFVPLSDLAVVGR